MSIEGKRIVGTRAWALVRQHFNVRFRLSGRPQLIEEICSLQQRGSSLRVAVAAMAREIRQRQREAV